MPAPARRERPTSSTRKLFVKPRSRRPSARGVKHRGDVAQMRTFSTIKGSLVSSAAQRIGSAAFFAPERTHVPFEPDAPVEHELSTRALRPATLVA